ncbi:pyridoxamine 5'-phosphate oxidase family protein [Magnetovibrio sp. PR-2]|uniref:pyridoxamine 5'-phosphate oxidase family protein n=1 Tax=Magnetovibrio sp. PR-2 TaxID=3120356 RepID=UPI002FCE1D41
MAKFFDNISDAQKAFIEDQHMFFVASAPLSQDGHVNVSPKGMDSFRVLGPNQVAYLDITGSANETSAHLQENGRITFMFCAFDGPPKILRLFGTGRVITANDEQWDEFSNLFPPLSGTRQIMVVDVHKTQESCGMGVPKFDFVEDRDALVKHWDKNGDDFVRDYWGRKNSESQDGLKPYALHPSTDD